MRQQEKPLAYLTEEEIKALFKAIGDNVRDQAMFHTIYYRGLRASEVGMIRLEDYRADAGRLLFRRLKGSRGGEYPLMPTERTWMNRWVRERGIRPGPLFPSRNHRGISRWQIRRLMREYCQKAGISPEKAHPHALKHSCGTHLSDHGTDIALIQDHLGHKEIGNTKRYVEISNKRRNDLGRQLEDAGWGRTA